MICIGIYEVHTPSVRLSRFATHVETGRPRKSFASIHGPAIGRCKSRRFRLSDQFAAVAEAPDEHDVVVGPPDAPGQVCGRRLRSQEARREPAPAKTRTCKPPPPRRDE